MIMSLTMTMLLFFIAGTRKSYRHNQKHNDATGSLCFGQLNSRSSTFGSVHFKMASSFEEKLASAVELSAAVPTRTFLFLLELMFMFMNMLMLTILMSLVGTKV